MSSCTRRPGRAVALALVTAALLSACGIVESAGAPTTSTPPSTAPDSSTTPSTVPESPDELEWSDCGGGECATLAVPLDHDEPRGETIDVAVYRKRAEDPDERIGSLFVNPGGPGASAIEFLRDSGSFYDNELRDRFDLVAIDPRGTGGSVPAQCVDSLDDFFEVDGSPDTGTERAALAEANARFGAACADRLGDALGHISTVATVRDMDLVRAALGEEQISYLGYSYGTQLGAIYADLFPDRVRAFVLDGAVDPTLSSLEAALTQLSGFERSLEVFLADCAADESCAFHNDGDPGAAFDALAARIDREPIPVGDRLLGPGQFEIGVANPLYLGELGWIGLADALADAQDGDGEALLDEFDDYTGRDTDGTYDPTLQAFWAISCLDSPSFGDPSSYPELEAEFLSAAPRFGRYFLYSGLICSEWPVPPRPAELPLDATGAAPIVVVGTTGDPATPYEEAVALADHLSSGVLLTYEGEIHTANAGFGLSACIDDAVIAYLVDLEVPAEGTECSA